MRLYLSSVLESEISLEKKKEFCKGLYVLFSFAYNNKSDCKTLIPYCKDVLMDSGAFTIMNKSKKDFDIMDYCKRYANFIKENNIEKFIELDIEGVFGFDKYKDCLHCLQDITGKNPIYVFHKWRGIDYYKELVRKYDYVALGDVSVGSGSRKLYQYFPWFLNEAHKNNCKVHGLAFTSMKDLQFMDFDSVDSSSWTMGARYARMFRFDGHSVRTYDCRRTEERELPSSTECKEYCLPEWKKLSEYFDKEYEPIW